jgi:hypothetical protein
VLASFVSPDANVAQLSIGVPTQAAITPTSGYDLVLAIEIDAVDANGNSVHQLSAPLAISIQFVPSSGQNVWLAQIVTTSGGTTEALPTNVTANADGSYTFTAATTHLSTYALVVPGIGTPVPQVYVPLIARDGPVAGW